jgi:hypothetical protein
MPVTMSVPVVVSVVVLMAVVPQLGFVEQKEKHQPHQQRQKQLMGTGFAFESFGQQMQKRGGHQGTGGHAQHVLGIATEDAKTQPSRHPDTANACHQSAYQNCQ